MSVSSLDEIVESDRYYIEIRLESKIPPLAIVLGFVQGSII